MAVLTEDQFAQKWGDKGKFADNTIQNFDEPLFRDFKEDIKDSFVPVAATSDVAHNAVFVKQDNGQTTWALSFATRTLSRLRLRRFTGGTLPAILPRPVLDPDRPVGLVAPGIAFPLVGFIDGPPTGPAAIAEYTRMVEDGNHFLVTGSDLGRAAYPVYQNGNFYATSVTEQDASTAAVRLPRVGAAWDAALAWPSTAAGIGVPVLLNTARVKWEQDVWAPGLTINILGENLAHGNVEQGAGWVAIRQNGGPIKVYDTQAANPYRAPFKVPGTVVPGDLEYWYHNGHGGELGWSAKRTVTVVATAKHVLTHDFGKPTRSVVLDATDPAINVGRIRDAYTALAQAGGGTFSTQAGSFPTNDTIQPKDGVRWVCDTAATGGVTSLFAKDWLGGGNLGMFGSNYWIGGATDGLEFIKTSGVKLGDAEAVVVLNNIDQVQLRRTKARWNEPYDTRPAGPVREAVPAQPMRLATSKNVFLDEVANTGSGMHLGSNSQVFLTNYTHRATHNADYMIYSNNMLGWCMIGYDLRDLDPTSTDGADRGIRCIKSGGQGGRNRYRHLEKGVGTQLGMVRSGTNQAPDDNQFEQDLDELNKTLYTDKVLSGTATTVKVPRTLIVQVNNKPEPLLKPTEHLVTIVAGRGVGQWRGIVGTTTDTITVDEPWLVVPDATSVLHTGWFSCDSTRYDVHYTAKPDNAQNPLYNHSSFYNGFGGVRGGIIDKCSGDGFRQGISYVATQHDATMVDQTAFNVVRNSQFPNSRWGRRFEAMPGQAGWFFDVPGLYCNLFSGNTYEAAIVAPLVYQLPRDTAGQVPNIVMLVEENQALDTGLNDFSPTFYNDKQYPPIPVLAGTMANSRQLVQQAQVALGAPGTVLVAGNDLGPLEPLPAGAAINTYGLLTFPETGQVLLNFLDTKQRPVPLDRTRVAGAGGASPAPGTGYTDAQIDALLANLATKQQVGDLIGAAPTALDTLAELAAWVQTDRSGVTDLLRRVGLLEGQPAPAAYTAGDYITISPTNVISASIAEPLTIVHQQATALDASAFGRRHVFTSGAGTYFGNTLPAIAGNLNKTLTIIIDADATGLWQFTGGDFDDRLWAGESLQLQCTDTGYRRIGGNKIPMTCDIGLTPVGPQTMLGLSSNGGVNALGLPYTFLDQSPGMAQQGHILIRRAGRYVPQLSGRVDAPQGSNIQLFAMVNGSANAENVAFNNLVSVGTVNSMSLPSLARNYKVGDEITFGYYFSAGGGAVWNALDYQYFLLHFSVTEITF